jgi:hypothetical protein
MDKVLLPRTRNRKQRYCCITPTLLLLPNFVTGQSLSFLVLALKHRLQCPSSAGIIYLLQQLRHEDQHHESFPLPTPQIG